MSLAEEHLVHEEVSDSYCALDFRFGDGAFSDLYGTDAGVAGDRTFSKWRGSLLDSVVGVFLTQNVSDFLSRYDHITHSST